MTYIIEDMNCNAFSYIDYDNHKMIFHEDRSKGMKFDNYIEAWRYLADHYIPYCNVVLLTEDD